tara:strand:- start:943 stop:1674 length:732 start_codon:yes stop_codon:yes gene_type:complete
MITEVIFPVYNESATLSKQIKIFNEFFEKKSKKNIFITIADNGSTDNTSTISEKLLKKKLIQKYEFIPQKGRGRAIKFCIKKSKADIVCYMDIDLSTDLMHFKELIDSISNKGYDISIGSRLSKTSKVIGRKKIREFTSRSYNLIIKFFFPKSGIKDMQCGFKAFSRKKILPVIDLVTNNRWFFDTELILISRNLNLKIYQIPVKWTDDPNTSVNIISTAIEDIVGLTKLRFKLFKKINLRND